MDTRTPPKPAPAEFEPLRPASRGVRRRLYIIGPLLWVAGLVVVAYVVRRGHAVGFALLILAGAFLLSVVILLPMRLRRVREERER